MRVFMKGIYLATLSVAIAMSLPPATSFAEILKGSVATISDTVNISPDYAGFNRGLIAKGVPAFTVDALSKLEMSTPIYVAYDPAGKFNGILDTGDYMVTALGLSGIPALQEPYFTRLSGWATPAHIAINDGKNGRHYLQEALAIRKGGAHQLGVVSIQASDYGLTSDDVLTHLSYTELADIVSQDPKTKEILIDFNKTSGRW